MGQRKRGEKTASTIKEGRLAEIKSVRNSMCQAYRRVLSGGQGQTQGYFLQETIRQGEEHPPTTYPWPCKS